MTPRNTSTKSQAAPRVSRRWSLLQQLVAREIEARYRGSGLGLVWTILTPLLMLLVYTFVFGTIFKSRWGTSGDEASPMEFAVILFSGLIVFQLFSEVINRAPTIILSSPTLVKRVVFPLELLVPVALGSSLVHAGISILVLIPFVLLVFGSVSVTLIWLPIITLPLCAMILGLGWMLAAFGTFIRDIGQAVSTLTTALLFLSPVFFPLSALPEWIRPVLVFNPITVPIEQFRRVLIFNQNPDFLSLLAYTAAASAIAIAGYYVFEKTRKGFADVL